MLNMDTLASALPAVITAGLVGAITPTALLTARRIVYRRALALAGSQAISLSALVSEFARSTQWPVLLLLAMFAGSLTLALPERLGAAVRSAAVIALLLQSAVWASHAITFWIDRYRTLRIDVDSASVTTMGALGLFARISLWLILLLLALDNVGIEVTAIVAGVGIGGIAIALAAQSILGDLFSSLSIVLDKPLVVGDFIIVGTTWGRLSTWG